MRHVPCLLVLFTLLPASLSWSVEVGFEFSGFVGFATSPPFGVPVETFSPVNGRFVFETESAATHDFGDCDCTGYRQQLYNGFSATFGTLSVRADDYIVQVSNDLDQGEGAIADLFTVRFASNLEPPLESPLIVAGVPENDGLFEVSFVDSTASIFDGSSLPEELYFADFDPAVGQLRDTASGEVDVFVFIMSLESIPVYSGDYDFDKDVDENDFLQWRDSFGSEGILAADGNRNFKADAADYTVWRDNLGAESLGGAALTTVPEPSSFLMILPIAILSRFNRAVAALHRI